MLLLVCFFSDCPEWRYPRVPSSFTSFSLSKTIGPPPTGMAPVSIHGCSCQPYVCFVSCYHSISALVFLIIATLFWLHLFSENNNTNRGFNDSERRQVQLFYFFKWFKLLKLFPIIQILLVDLTARFRGSEEWSRESNLVSAFTALLGILRHRV